MLDDFVLEHRDTLISRARARVSARTIPLPTDIELSRGIPVFLDQLVVALRIASSSEIVDHADIEKSAREHGAELLRMGLSIAQVVHDYGDVCQTITELAVDLEARISPHEFRTLNLCLDDAIAEAVTEYARQNELRVAAVGTERLGVLAHELRNLLNTAMLSFESIKTGRVSPGGSTGLVHARSLLGLRDLADRSIAEVRLDAAIDHREAISVSELVEEIEIGAMMQARARDMGFALTSTERTAVIEGDRQIIVAAISNLIQNAFKFGRKQGLVSLRVKVIDSRVLFEIEDQCGGLPPGEPEKLMHPYTQSGANRTGVGLGLTICTRAAKANGGELRVLDLPGRGCVFTFDLPLRVRVD